MSAATLTPKRERTRRERGTLTAEQLAAKTVVLEFRLGSPTWKRGVSTSEVSGDKPGFDESAVHVRKELLDPDVLSALNGMRARMVRVLRANSVRCSMLAGGMWLVPIGRAEAVDKLLSEHLKERGRLVADLLDKYDAHRRAAKKRLGKLYREDDYPTPAEIRKAYSVSRRFLSFNVPAALEGLNKELYQRELARVEAEVAEASSEIRAALREAFAGLVAHLAEKLTPGEDGKARVFKDTTVAKLQDFLATFAARDLTGDTQLSALAKKAQGVLDGLDTGALRTEDDVRGKVLGAMQEIQSKLTDMNVIVRTRKISVEEDV